MRKYLYIQYTSMIVVCFICGVVCYQLFDIGQVQQIIKYSDRRLLQMDKPGALECSSFHSCLKYCIILFDT